MTWGPLQLGGMDVLFGGIRPPCTLGVHLHSYTWEDVRQE